MKQLLHFLFSSRSKSLSLSELDEIYETAISKLPAYTKKDYCYRVIARVSFEIGQTKCGKEVKKLKQLAKAAKREATHLDLINNQDLGL